MENENRLYHFIISHDYGTEEVDYFMSSLSGKARIDRGSRKIDRDKAQIERTANKVQMGEYKKKNNLEDTDKFIVSLDTQPVCICPPAMTVVVKLATDAHCAEKSLDMREFTFLKDFHRRFTMKTSKLVYSM